MLLVCYTNFSSNYIILCCFSGMFLVDDDLLISARDVQFAFRVWKVGMCETMILEI